MPQPLEFSVPTTARTKELSSGERLVFAHDLLGSCGFVRERFKDGPTMFRNIIAWYLTAAGIPSADIATHLSISSSRVGALARKTREQLYSRTSLRIAVMKWSAREGNLTEEERTPHLLAAVRQEMMAAEAALARCYRADLHVVSGSLRLGRKAYLELVENCAGQKCGCNVCKFLPDGLSPYWVDKPNPDASAP